MHLRIATRKSALALWQAEHVAALLQSLPEVTDVKLVPLSTKGDEILDRSLQKIGGKGLFIKELEIAMQAGEADLAVHSMKDVPAEMPPGFCIAAVLERANPADALLTNDGKTLDELRQGAKIGSSSLRRQAQLKALRPDVVIEPLRGNVNTRLAKLEAGDYDAIMLACAGVQRLGLDQKVSEIFTPDRLLPAAAQGIIGIECLSDRAELRAVLDKLNHAPTSQVIKAERGIAKFLEANCQSPVAAYAEINDGKLNLQAVVALPDGSRVLRDAVEGDPADAAALAMALGQRLVDQGAADILAALEAG
ncbi:MAG TPA: hydroxymethylbilane synthase [Woeseiaceae bacterium]